MIRALMLTSDKYLHCVAPFMYQWDKHIGGRIPVVVGCYEKPPVDLPDYATVISMGEQKDFTWSSGLKRFILTVNDPIFMFLLEDYFVIEANLLAIQGLTDVLSRNATIGRIDLTRDVYSRNHTPWRALAGVPTVRALDTSMYQWSTQASLWRKDFMLKWMADHENPWQAEKGCSKRIINARKDERQTIPSVLGVSSPVLKYVNAIGGAGKKPSEWDMKKFPSHVWKELYNQGLVGA